MIASVLVDDTAIFAVAPVLQSDDFYREKNAWVYEAMLALWKRGDPTSPIPVVHELGQRGLLEAIGGPAYLTQLTTDLPTAMHAGYYATLVHRDAQYRRLLTAAGRIAQIAYDGGPDWSGNYATITGLVGALSYDPGTQAVRSAQRVADDLAPRLLEWMDDPAQVLGLRTGLWGIDCLVDGFEPERLIILCGATGSGKSMLGLTISTNVAEGVKNQPPVPVYYASAEMSAEQLLMRAVLARAGVDRKAARWSGSLSPDQKNALLEAHNWVATLPIAIDDAGPWDWATVASRIQQHVAGGRCGLAIVDHIDLLTYTGIDAENRYATQSAITREAKALAKKLQVPIVLISQLSRALAGRDDKRPKLSDLRDSGNKEQDADIVIGWHRPAQWAVGLDPKDALWHEGYVCVLKNRDGGTGDVKMYVDLDLGRLRDWVTP